MRITTAMTIRILDVAIQTLEMGWTKGDLAKDAKGQSVWPTQKGACQWCAAGALDYAANEVMQHENAFTRSRAYQHALEAVEDNLEVSLVQYNDAPHRRASSVICRFKEARKALVKSKSN